MNPVVMGSGVLPAETVLDAMEAELAGAFPGRLILASRRPDLALFRTPNGHRQIMDIWLVQIACDAGVKLATRDGGCLANWPTDTVSVP